MAAAAGRRGEWTLDEWAELVRADLGRALDGIVAAGQHLIQAREQHPREFVAWLASGACGVRRSYGYALIRIAEHPLIGAGEDSGIAGNLPRDATSLSLLATLEPDELLEAVAAGEVRADMPRAEARALVARRRDAAGEDVADIRRLRAADGRTRWTTILADPPWEYANRATRGAAAAAYETMTLDELAGVDVPAADDAHLYLCATNAFLRPAFELAESWGFEPRVTLVWVKKRLGLGNFFRHNAEFVLFATRGGLATLRDDQPTAFTAPASRRHSRKPDELYDLIESCSPGPYLELFATRARVHWSSIGKQLAPGDEAPSRPARRRA